MTTEQMFKQIYQELKKKSKENKGRTFLKRYNIPSINYDLKNDILNDKYFISGIEMELDRMMGFFENKIYYSRYRDKYFFSNNEKLAKDKMLEEMNKDKNTTKNKENEFE